MTTAANGDQKPDYLGMSDDDFLKVNGPAEVEAEENSASTTTTEETTAEKATSETTSEDTNTSEEQANGSQDTSADDGTGAGGDTSTGSDGKAAATDGAAVEPGKTEPEKPAGDKTAVTGDPTKAEEKPVDYEGFFKQVMAPFKANGREFTLKSPEEAIRLMQMGAGYGRKLQNLQPALKTLKMLEKADLLDEKKLSFLIDINNKNPDAIKKLIADSGIDPLELNIGDNVSYTPKDHSVSDKEMGLSGAMTDLQEQEGGQETLVAINREWDQESKALLWDQPQLLSIFHEQRVNGIYAQVTAEIDRQKVLGKIPHNTPFIEAYKIAGDYLTQTNGFKNVAPQASIRTQSGAAPQTQVIATRAAAPKAQVQNNDKAAAAASTKTNPASKATTKVNPLEMADDDFIKAFEGRL